MFYLLKMNYKKILFVFFVILIVGFLLKNLNIKEPLGDDIDKEKTIEVSFYKAKFCSHCKVFEPEFMKFKKTTKQGDLPVGFKIIDADDDGADKLAKANKIEGYPTVIFTKNGKNIVYEGKRTEEGLTAFLQTLLVK